MMDDINSKRPTIFNFRVPSDIAHPVNQGGYLATTANTSLHPLNEELQVANEELRVINEEFQTVNADLSQKIAELDRANADLANFFANTQIPVIFLDLDRRITRFTPQATDLFALIDSDIGRPITDLNAHFCNGDLLPLIAQVLQTFAPVECEVQQSTYDRWWIMHIGLYRTLANRVDGVVISFADITALKQTEAVLKESHDALERRVVARTQELELANTSLCAHIAQQIRDEQAREHLLQQIVTAQEEERRRIARELHDEIGQNLTALILSLKALHDNSTIDAHMTDHIAQIQAMAVQISEDVRSLAVHLRPSALDDLGLALALSTYIEQWSARAHVAVDLHSSGLDGVRMPLSVETTIYRLVQESLTNVRKHAQATEVSVIIERRADEVCLIIEDDGVGFTVPTTPSAPDATPPLGLIGMTERAVLLGGSLTIESEPGRGTSIFVRIPLPKDQN